VLGPVKRGARLSVRLPVEVLARLRVVSKLEGRSMADWAFRATEAALVRAEARLARRRNKLDR
jgi:predicted DNA-binding protein